MTLQWLLGWWNLIFVVPFGLALVYLGVYTLSGWTFGEADADADLDHADADLHLDADADADIHVDVDSDADLHLDADGDADVDAPVDADTDAGADHDADHEVPSYLALIAWLGVGRVPLSIVLMVLLLTWGGIGFATNRILLEHGFKAVRALLFAIPLAFSGSMLCTRIVTRLVARYLPTNETYARRRHELLGCEGEAIYSIDRHFGLVNVRDDRGDLFQVGCRTTGDEQIAKGAGASRQLHRQRPDISSATVKGRCVMMLVVFFIVGVALAIGPWFVQQLSATTQIAFSAAGVLVLVMLSVVSVITKLYRKASANMAYVKTGMGGADVIMDAGRIILPVVHQVIPVSLETMRLNVERRGPHALITKDNLRVDLSAEFYIKVQSNRDDILQAARSLGGRNVQPDAVSELVQEKLVSALRTVAATKELVELHAKRDEFASAVQEIVIHDLSHNGLTLESVTISSLDQTDPTQLQERNVFDAQGLRKIAEITQKARVERNLIERDAEKQVVEKNVSTSKHVLDLQRDQAEFEAEQKMKVANVRAAREREIAEFKLAQDEAISKRDIEKMQAIETTEVQRTLAVEQAQVAKKVALVTKVREQETAEILKKQAVEVAERAKEVAVAEKERERAEAQAEVLNAEAAREKAKQQVVTVTVTSEAEREAQKKLIAAQQEVKQKQIRDQTEADVLAYTKVKQAEAEKQAAEMSYAAKLKLAEGDAVASSKRAEGDKAVKMVDVNVERERVNVEQAKVEVERQSLANKSEFEEAALKFELEKLRIEAEKQVRIVAAESMGNMLAKANMQIFADPDTMARMSGQFMRAASLGTAMDGLLHTMPPKGQELLAQLLSNVTSQFKPAEVAAVPTNGNGAAHVAVTSEPVEVVAAKKG